MDLQFEEEQEPKAKIQLNWTLKINILQLNKPLMNRFLKNKI